MVQMSIQSELTNYLFILWFHDWGKFDTFLSRRYNYRNNFDLESPFFSQCWPTYFARLELTHFILFSGETLRTPQGPTLLYIPTAPTTITPLAWHTFYFTFSTNKTWLFIKYTMYQCHFDVDMLNAVKRMLADVLSISPSRCSNEG